jgi:hypothetical protein
MCRQTATLTPFTVPFEHDPDIPTHTSVEPAAPSESSTLWPVVAVLADIAARIEHRRSGTARHARPGAQAGEELAHD